MINFLAPYKLALFGLLAALVIGYIVILNLQVAHYKNKTDELRIEVKPSLPSNTRTIGRSTVLPYNFKSSGTRRVISASCT